MYAEGQGYHVLGSEQQRTKLKASETDALLGRKPSEIPARLSKVLYIPKHGSSQFHLPLYDVSNEFRKTIGDALIGSSLFTTKLAMMDTPSGEGTDAEVRYLIDLEKRPVGGSEEVVAKIQRRALGDVDGQVTMSFPMETGNDNFEIRRGSADTSQGEISISASYPIPDSKVRNATVRHPYYSFIIPDSTEMQWQTFPAAYGPLRHTLVKTNSTQGPGELPRDEDVEAIFHHIWNSALPLGREQSEGVLILPDKFGRELELLYVGSLMGLLWQVRRLATSDSKGSKKAHKHDSEAGDVKFTRKLFSKVFFKKQ